MPSQAAIDAANEITYESWKSDREGDLYCNGPRKLKEWPALRDMVADAIDQARREAYLRCANYVGVPSGTGHCAALFRKWANEADGGESD